MPIYALGDDEPVIDETAYVHPEAVVIGRVAIAARASVWPCAVLRGDFGRIVIGRTTSVQDGAVIHADVDVPTIVGSGCAIGHNVHLEGCQIEDGVLIGSSATVLAGAVIGQGALVGAGALVIPGMQVPAGAMVLGVPARIKSGSRPQAIPSGGADFYAENAARYRRQLRRLY